MKHIWCNGFAEIYAQLEEGETYVVLWFCRDLYLIGGGDQSDIGICPLFFIYRSAMRCAKFGVSVLKASMLNWAVSICHGYMCIVLYMTLIWCNGFAEIYARSAMRCAKCGVLVLKASLLNWGVSICHGYMCIVLYMKVIWCNGFAEIYA